MKKTGQTALILILLTAAALIFLAITLNWGRIAQTKALITVAADETATYLASYPASYGEMQKQTYLNDTNQITESTGIIIPIIGVIIAIIAVILAPFTGGASLMFGLTFAEILAAAALVMAVVNLALQVVVVQPGITKLWNSLMTNQPVAEQFYEQGITTALQGAVTDQANITDYLDSNANGYFGNNISSAPNDVVSRFALFYGERLKMINEASSINPSVVFFYNQLNEFINGETCAQNINDHNLCNSATPPNYCPSGGIAVFPACTKIAALCSSTPSDPVCQQKIPSGFQLNDTCNAFNHYNTSTYNPYCDPCCQPPIVQDTSYCALGSTTCTYNPYHPNPFIAVRPSYCPNLNADCSPSNPNSSPNAADCIPSQCYTNNPYNSSPGSNDSPYPYLYDATFQNYASGLSFLDQFGRDQQLIPMSPAPPLTTMTPNVMSPSGVTPILEFPNGIYPFFWLMDNYSPEVDNINSTALQSAQVHWCVAGGSIPAAPAAPPGFPDLAQLSLPYTCIGQDCCVNNVISNVSNGSTITSSPLGTINLTGGPVVSITYPTNNSYFQTGTNITVTVNATDTSGTIQGVELYAGASEGLAMSGPGPVYTYTTLNGIPAGAFTLYAVATDSFNVSTTSPSITVNGITPPTVSISVPGVLTPGSNVAVTATATTGAGDSISTVTVTCNPGTSVTSNGSSAACTLAVPAKGSSYTINAQETDADGLTPQTSSASGTV